jgi:hypothetical protein
MEWWPIPPTELWELDEKAINKSVILYGTRNHMAPKLDSYAREKNSGVGVHHMHYMHCPKFQRSPCVGDGQIQGNPQAATLPAIANM